jgi:hypothetical protein
MVYQAVLHRQMAPRTTCLAALRSGQMGTPEQPLREAVECALPLLSRSIGVRRLLQQALKLSGTAPLVPDGIEARRAAAAWARRRICGKKRRTHPGMGVGSLQRGGGQTIQAGSGPACRRLRPPGAYDEGCLLAVVSGLEMAPSPAATSDISAVREYVRGDGAEHRQNGLSQRSGRVRGQFDTDPR